MVDGLGWLAFAMGFLGGLFLMGDRGYRDGMKLAWFVAAIVVPYWFQVAFRSITVDALTGVAFAVVLATLYRPVDGRPRFTACDASLLLIVTTCIASELANRTLIPGTLYEFVRTWVLPYLVGRLFLRSWDELGPTLRFLMPAAMVISVFAILEAISKTNLMAMISGKSWELLETSEGFRWGLKRAQGNTNHPIYFGLLLSLLLPWILTASKQPQVPSWWRIVPWMLAAAAFVTVSRSAHVAIMVVFAADLFFRKRSIRVPMMVVGAAAVIGFVVFRDDVLSAMGSYAGEQSNANDTVRIYGVKYDYTGTKHRDLLEVAYAEAIDQAGWFGYGTSQQDMPKDPYLDPRFASVDHQYLLHLLRYGYLGTASLLLFGVCGTITLAWTAWRADGPLAGLAGGMCGAFLAVAVLARGVAFSTDYLAMWLFTAGIGATLASRERIVITSVTLVRGPQ